MSIELAERIVGRNLDRTTQMQLVDSFIDEVSRDDSAMADRVEIYAHSLLEVARGRGQPQ